MMTGTRRLIDAQYTPAAGSMRPTAQMRGCCTYAAARSKAPGSGKILAGKLRSIPINILIWLMLGGLIGWAASALLRMRESIPLNVIVGIVGAVVGGWFLSPFVGVSTINQGNFSVPGLIVSFFGAVILLLIVNFVRRAALR